MAITDKNPIKALYNNGVAYALSELQATDTIAPSYINYDSTGNTIIKSTNVEDALVEVEDALTVFDAPVTTGTPYFSTYLTGLSELTNISDYNLIKFDTVEYDPVSNFDIINNRYTASASGTWIINTLIHPLDPYQGSLGAHRIAIYKNGSIYKIIGGYRANKYNSDRYSGWWSCSASIHLNINDYIDIRVMPAQDTSFNGIDPLVIGTGIKWSSFSGYLHRTTL